MPTSEELKAELDRVNYRSTFRRTLTGAIFALVTIAAAAVLVATLWMPVLRISGTSMNPTLVEGQLVTAVKDGKFQRGDMIAFYYNNKVLVKRVVAMAGEWVNIDADGNVYINDVLFDEPYLADNAKAFGECDIKLPYQVPEGKIFVLGDHRSVSVDSRSTVIGCVAQEQIVGKLIYRVWPLAQLGSLT